MRTISIGFPSGVPKMTLWEGTEDEEKFAIKRATSKRPYITAYGVKYELDQDEVNALRHLMQLPMLKIT